MKIAFVHQPLGAIIDPGQHADSLTILVYELARRVASSCEVVVYSLRGAHQPEVETREGVHYRRLSLQGERDPMLPFLRRFSLLRDARHPLFASHWFHRLYIDRIARDLQQQNCDVVCVETFPQFPAAIRKLNPASRVALHVHCEWLNQLDRDMISKQMEPVDLILGCSDYITQKARAALPEHANRCRTLMNGCDVERFRSIQPTGRGAKRLLFVNRVSPEKGAHVLIEAFRLIADRYPDAELDIVGPEWVPDRSFTVALSEQQRVRALSRFEGKSYLAALKEAVPAALAKRVRFPGLVPHEQLHDYYANACALIYPSVWDEPFGLPIIEAMAAGVPVIASLTGGIPEIVDHAKTGLLVGPDNPRELAGAISLLFEQVELCERMAKAVRQRAASYFSWDRMAKEFLNYVYETVPQPILT